METRSAHHKSKWGTHAPLWCDECKRAHDGSEADARTLLGDHGSIGAFGYAWCEREGAYHLNTVKRALPDGRVVGSLAELWTQAGGQPQRECFRTAPTVADAYNHDSPAQRFAARYESQRTHNAPMLRGGGSVAKVDAPHVVLTLGARHALRAANEWGTPERTQEREREIAALRARIDARG